MKTKFLQDVSESLKLHMHSAQDYQLAMVGLECELDESNSEIRNMLSSYKKIRTFEDTTTFNSLCRVLVECKDAEYCIYVRADYVFRHYCRCTPEDPGYDEEMKCCGEECDFVAPRIYVEKCIPVTEVAWQGNIAKELWEKERKYTF